MHGGMYFRGEKRFSENIMLIDISLVTVNVFYNYEQHIDSKYINNMVRKKIPMEFKTIGPVYFCSQLLHAIANSRFMDSLYSRILRF